MAMLIVPSLARGQDVRPREPCDRRVSVSMDSSQFPMIGLRFGTPLRVGAYTGWWWAGGRNTPCVLNIRVLSAELGLGGAQLSYGIMYGKGRQPHRYLPVRLQAAALQSWWNPVSAAPNTTYVGVEAQLQMFYGVRVSQFWPLLGESSDPFWGVSVVMGF